MFNRVKNEQEAGHFHMTVRELQDLFNNADADFSGMLEQAEILSILGKVHLVTDPEEMKACVLHPSIDSCRLARPRVVRLHR